MRRTPIAVACVAVPLAGCVSFNTVVPSRMNAQVADVFQQANSGNWTVRVHADSVYEGRVSLVQRDAARVGGTVVVFDRVTRIERSYNQDLGDAKGGALVDRPTRGWAIIWQR